MGPVEERPDMDRQTARPASGQNKKTAKHMVWTHCCRQDDSGVERCTDTLIGQHPLHASGK